METPNNLAKELLEMDIRRGTANDDKARNVTRNKK